MVLLHYQRAKSGRKLDETMIILIGMMDEENVEETDVVTEAASSALLKHVSPDEEKRIIDAMEDALEEQ